MTTASSISSLHEARRAFGRGIRTALFSGGQRVSGVADHPTGEESRTTQQDAPKRTDDHA